MDKSKLFLAKVHVKQFAISVKQYAGHGRKERRIKMLANPNPDDIFTIISATQIKEGQVWFEGDDVGYIFKETGSKQVFIVAKSIGRRYKVLLEDIEAVEVAE